MPGSAMSQLPEFMKFINCWTILILSCCAGVSANTIMNLAGEVMGYTFYGDVTPVKYSVPTGLSHLNITIRINKNKDECPDYTTYVSIQHGGLPLVQQTESSFPPNFLMTDPTFMLEMKPYLQIIFTVVRPLPGPWFIIGYDDYITAQAIKPKGLDSKTKCFYSIMSRFTFGEAMNTTTIAYNTAKSYAIGTGGQMFSFKIPRSTFSYNVVISKCVPETCNVTMAYLPSQVYNIQVEYCQDGSHNCSMHVTSPILDDIQLIEIRYAGLGASQLITFSVTLQQCAGWSSLLSGSLCKTMSLLDKIQPPEIFNAFFGYLAFNSLSRVNLTKAPVIVLPFTLEDPLDIGGTLKWSLQMVNYTYGLSTYVHICGGLIYNRLPAFNSSFDLCDSLPQVINRTVTGVSYSQIVQYVPYPRAGTWHIVIQARCYEQGTDLPVTCPANVTADISLEVQQCLENSCSDRGTCELIGQGSQNILFTACKCEADYQGYACTDSTKAQSVLIQMAAAFLLTMSNFFFLPAIILSIKRRFAVEAFVYSFTMFFSTFYHACDGDRLGIYKICIATFDVLQASDFFGSYCSIWYTLIAMAQIRIIWLGNVLQVIGPFGILVGIVYDRRNVCLIAVPLLSGIAIIAISWGLRMYKRKKLYPSWKRYVIFFLPGCVLAATGGSVFIFLETRDNYKYLHSFWHVCVASCICFLLPPHPAKRFDVQDTRWHFLQVVFQACKHFDEIY